MSRACLKAFAARRRVGRPVRAVSDASFTLRRGETLGLVGESGCGKSTLARLVLHLIDPMPDVSSSTAATSPGPGDRRRLRRRIQIVFQDALSSLNPRMTVGVNIAEPMRLQGIGGARRTARRSARAAGPRRAARRG